MTFSFTSLHPLFVAQASGPDLRDGLSQAQVQALREGMDRYAVLVFRQQPMSDEQQLEFAQHFDGALHAKTGISALAANRFGNEALTDIATVDRDGKQLAADDRKRQYGLANRLWHTDASFVEPAGRHSMLSARVVPEVSADTEFADMRAAYDELDSTMQKRIADLRCHHSIAYSRQVLGFEFSEEEAQQLIGAIQPLVKPNQRTGRRALYLASHASRIIDWPLPDGRLLLRELIEHATQPHFVYRHQWQTGDFLIYDNGSTMHRACSFDDLSHRRELRRVTTLESA